MQLHAERHHWQIRQEDQAVQACAEPFILPREQMKDKTSPLQMGGKTQPWQTHPYNYSSIKSFKESHTKYIYATPKALTGTIILRKENLQKKPQNRFQKNVKVDVEWKESCFFKKV